MNSLGRFALAAAIPMLLSGSMIVGLWLFTPYAQTPVHVLAFSVLVSGVLQATVMLYALKRAGFSFSLKFPHMDQDIKTLLKRMGPGVLGGGVMQINVWINTVIATTLLPGAVSYLYFADRLAQFPLALIGTAIGIALLPALSAQLKQGKLEQALDTQNRALEMALLFAIPAAVALGILAEPIMKLLFERGAFLAADTKATATALAAFSLGIPAFVLTKIFIPPFFAVGDTKTPVKIAIICLIFNVVMNLILMQFIAHVGLALSTSLSSWLNVALLVFILYRRKHFKLDTLAGKRLPLIVGSAVCMGAVLWFAKEWLDTLKEPSSMMFLASLGAISALAGITYFSVVHLTGGFRIQELRKSFAKTK
jgi:putative peptidoglycan lipid II flippase